MEKQKETLIASKKKVQETKQYTVDAKRILVIMGNRAIMHKVCVFITCVILFAAIIAVGYEGFGKK